MDLKRFNNLNERERRDALSNCCGATHWVDKMLTSAPVEKLELLLELSDKNWYDCTESDWLEAFTHHPKIGDLKSLENKFALTKEMAGNEQSGINVATENVLIELADYNKRYEDKFGYIFIVCATGKSANEMLELLKSRINNSPEEEIKIAMEEQNKITKLRLEKFLTEN
ncbi:MAG: OHCU decarboxylase [Bacteroidetes bacterium]|nr:2-oxo-4-hydroxy-4-carboxy-5-ureidoimidazoline decarboxylase [Bacteroidia bacterium]PCH68983.1 MAG: OHCU decarboxylase [Bacteroidota bacterium]